MPRVQNKFVLQFIQVLPKKKTSFECNEQQNPARAGDGTLDVHPVPVSFLTACFSSLPVVWNEERERVERGQE
jgi:hypothetical protein